MTASNANELTALLRRFTETRDVGLLGQAIPYARFLGLTCEEAEGGAVAKLRYSPELIGDSSLPALHGGTLGALLESACIFELVRQARLSQVPKIVTLSVDFLRSGRPQDTWARATITRLGRRVANVHATAWQDDPAKPIAAAHAILLVPSTETAEVPPTA